MRRLARLLRSDHAWPDGRILTREGIMNGTVNLNPVGNNGFGYDPIFYLPEYQATTAQLTSEEKNLLSHRGKAAEAIVDALYLDLSRMGDQAL